MNDRFIELLTKEFGDTLTENEKHELSLMIQNDKGLREQKEILKRLLEKRPDSVYG